MQAQVRSSEKVLFRVNGLWLLVLIRISFSPSPYARGINAARSVACRSVLTMLAFEGHILGLNHSTTATTPSSAEKPGSSFMKNEPERQKVEIDHDFSYSPSQRVRDQDFDRVCVLGRGA